MSLSLSTSSEVSYEILPTFLASLRSVGTAFTLAAVGIYLNERGFVVGEGKKTLALIAQQVTIPALLFSKIVYCNQDWSTDPCPNVTDSLEEVWMLLFWPIYVVGWGLLVGYGVAKVTSTPPQHLRSVLVSCALANSTGVPITLLSVIHANFPAQCELGRMDPTLFLSVYLILYPVLQWGIGGFLLAPATSSTEKYTDKNIEDGQIEALMDDTGMDSSDESSSTPEEVGLELTNDEKKAEDQETGCAIHPRRSTIRSFGAVDLTRNVLNNTCIPILYQYSHSGMQDTDASMYVSNTNLAELPTRVYLEQATHTIMISSPLRSKHLPTSTMRPSSSNECVPLLKTDNFDIEPDKQLQSYQQYSTPSLPAAPVTSIRTISTKSIAPTKYKKEPHVTFFNTLRKIVSRCLQPPVIGALCGIFVASIPMIRGIFVDTVHRANQAPLQWFFDGLYSVGQAAVPINMIILGCNISSSQKSVIPADGSDTLLPTRSMIGIVIGKMLILPIVGVLSCVILKHYFWSIPAGKYNFTLIVGIE